MTEGNIPKKTAEQRARLRQRKAVRRHGDHQPDKATPKRRGKRDA
jgi:hypothetical protein